MTEKLEIRVERSNWPKCERCWNFSPNVGCHPHWPDLCLRCALIVEDMVKDRLWEPNGEFAEKEGPICCECGGY